MVKWVNNNANPLVDIAEFTTGKSLNSDFKEDKPRAESGEKLAWWFFPAGKVETTVAKNVIVNQGEKQIVKNAAAGKTGEKIVNQALSKEFPGKKVLNQVTGKFANGTKTVIDNIVLDPKTNKAILTNETKTGAAKLSAQQAKRQVNGEAVTLVGKNAGSLKGQTISTSTTTNRTSRVNVSTKEVKIE